MFAIESIKLFITKKTYEHPEAYLRLLIHGSRYDKYRNLAWSHFHGHNENIDSSVEC